MGVGVRGVIDCRRCAEWSRVAEGIDQAASCDGRGGLRFMHRQQSGPIAQPSPAQLCFSAFESFPCRSRHVSAIILTISPRNSAVLSFSNPETSGVISFLSARRVTPVRFRCVGQRMSWGWSAGVPHRDFGREQWYMQCVGRRSNWSDAVTVFFTLCYCCVSTLHLFVCFDQWALECAG